MTEDFTDMCFVLGRIVGENEDIVEVDNDINIKKVAANVVHKSLEGSRCISETKRHNKPFERTVTGVEGGFPFITFGNADQGVRMAEVESGICASSTSSGMREIVVRPRKSTQS